MAFSYFLGSPDCASPAKRPSLESILLIPVILCPLLGIVSGPSAAYAAQDPFPQAVQVTTSSTGLLPADQPPDITKIFVDNGDYYLVRGKKVALRRDATRVAIKLRADAFARQEQFKGSVSQQSSELYASLQLGTGEFSLATQRLFAKNRIAVVHVQQAGGAGLTNRTMTELAGSPSAEFVYPVYVAEKGVRDLILTEEMLVRFADEYRQEDVANFCSRNNLSIVEKTKGKNNVWVVRLNDPQSRSTLDVANSVSNADGVVWAEPNFLMEIELNAVDPLYQNQWHLNNTGQSGSTPDADVDGPEAWAITTGSPDITIAIVDTGVDLGHEDLDIYINPGESGSGRENNGIDDDGNGYVDDYRGWDFYDSDNNPGPGTDGHGTSCAGVSAAIADNGLGGRGISSGSKILAVKIVSNDGATFVAAQTQGEAIIYAADIADVISCSWGGGTESSFVNDAIDYAVSSGRAGKGTPVFFATGNSAARGWRQYGISGFPAGSMAHGWLYEKDGSIVSGADAAWLDDVTLQNGTLENFDSVTPPALPAGWYNYTDNDGDWYSTDNPANVRGGSGNALQSGAIGNGLISGIYVYKTYTVGGDYTYWIKVEAGLGDGLNALYWNGASWVVYNYFWGEGISYPASYANSIAVGAATNFDIQSTYSQYGAELDFVAPSNGGTLGITTTDITGSGGYSSTNYTDGFGGTSSATPLAAGIAALMLSCNPELTATEVRSAMHNTADKIGTDSYDSSGWNKYYGYGRVNAYRAVASVCTLPGDVDLDGDIDLGDVIGSLQLMAGSGAGSVDKSADVNGDGMIGMEEVLYDLDKVAFP